MGLPRLLLRTATVATAIRPVLSLQTLKPSCINTACTAVRLTIDNPPVNLWDTNVITDLNDYLVGLSYDNSTKVVVFSSGVPGFFGAPIDLNLFAGTVPAEINATEIIEKYYDNLDRLIETPVIFIAEINGRAWGAGDEHLLRMDMRFAGPDTQLGAPEAAVGLIHVGGLQQLTRLIGPGRALEYMASAAQVDGQEAAWVGWVNSVWPTAEALRRHVNLLASRIALFDVEVLRATKASIAEQAPSKAMLARDLRRFNELASLDFTARNIADILSLSRNQSKWWEYDNNDNIVDRLYIR